jgi:putative restriction endonuclease
MSVLGVVAVTDNAWIEYLRGRPDLDEVNFWRPSAAPVKYAPGTPWFFKAKAPVNTIVGGGFFVHYTSMPVAIAWDYFTTKNGAPDLDSFQRSLRRIRPGAGDATSSSSPGAIGCVVLSSPYFFQPEDFIAAPSDFSPNTQVRKGYDLSSGEGRRLWDLVQDRIVGRRVKGASPLIQKPFAYGEPRLVLPRLGQGGFRSVVIDAYERRCAVTGERTRPALEAAHIKPYSIVQEHDVRNGVSLRSDIHKLLDLGYVTIDPTLRFRVSRAIRDEFENGRDYYALHERLLRLPEDESQHPDRAALEWHASTRYRGD